MVLFAARVKNQSFSETWKKSLEGEEFSVLRWDSKENLSREENISKELFKNVFVEHKSPSCPGPTDELHCETD